MQQRNDLSDADETDVKKKKRKRSLSRDLSTEMGTSAIKSKTQSSPRKSQKVALSDNGKNVIKIPVGGALGALSNVRGLSQPSPAKKQRTSKSKSSKVNAQTSAGGIKGVEGGDATPRTMVPSVSGAVSVGATGNPQTAPGFISLAAKGSAGVLKPSVSQSYLSMSASPSIIKQGKRFK